MFHVPFLIMSKGRITTISVLEKKILFLTLKLFTTKNILQPKRTEKHKYTKVYILKCIFVGLKHSNTVLSFNNNKTGHYLQFYNYDWLGRVTNSRWTVTLVPKRKDEIEFNQTEKTFKLLFSKKINLCYLPRERQLVVVQVLQRVQGQLEQQVVPQQRARLALGRPQLQQVLLLLGAELHQQALAQHQLPGPQLRQQEAHPQVQQEPRQQVQ